MSMLINASEITKEELTGFRKPTKKERNKILFPEEPKSSKIHFLTAVFFSFLIWFTSLIYLAYTESPRAAILTFLMNLVCLTAFYIIMKIDEIKEYRHPSKEFEILECRVYKIQDGQAYISANNQICSDAFEIQASVCNAWNFHKDMPFWLLHYTKPNESYHLTLA